MCLSQFSNYITMKHTCITVLFSLVLALAVLALFATPASADLELGSEEIVQASGADISVPGYSVPSFVFWNGDTLRDLVIGEGSGTVGVGKVRIYLNEGTPSNPLFNDYFYAQSLSVDLTSPGGG
jgi:hypothetical protein